MNIIFLDFERVFEIVIVNLIIVDDVGAVVTKEKFAKMLEKQLPITEPHVGLINPTDNDIISSLMKT